MQMKAQLLIFRLYISYCQAQTMVSATSLVISTPQAKTCMLHNTLLKATKQQMAIKRLKERDFPFNTI